jgi:hypothetical protein
VEPRVKHRREPVRRLHPSAAAGDARPVRPLPARARPARADDRTRSQQQSPIASTDVTPLRDRGLVLLAVFTAATLLIVALVCLVGAIDHWWVLIPVMAADLAVTGAVLAMMSRLLDDGYGG